MEISNQLLFHFPSKFEGINETRRVNYTPTIFLLNECSLSWPEKILSGNPELFSQRIIPPSFSISQFTFEKYNQSLYFFHSYQCRKNGNLVGK